tara:strand:+ start:36758 stop:37543 length:786 start_codon:yes stop_codon:yes gene_type:complete
MTSAERRPALLVTRPDGQADELLDQLQLLGCEVRHQPLMHIRRFSDDDSPEAQAVRQRILATDEYYAVIAISQNAAESGLDWMDRYWPQMPAGVLWFGVGPTTALPMQQAGLNALIPEERFDSEGLLQRPELQTEAVRDQKILIWRGVGGRETLASVLRERGARVDYAELYTREPVISTAERWQALLGDRPVVLLSSAQALDIIEQQVPDLAHKVTALLVPGERGAGIARERGYSQVLVATSARNEDTLHTLREWIAAGAP